ncbi:response regulator transcription factor [Mesorhizobium sp. 1B3]|uniref:response regulator transcription factor n=1 Tax=Mesorhizobium sp. 1B3 TaxID=3243599 RepID=UPI003D967F80
MQTVRLFQHALEQLENQKPTNSQQVYALTQELKPLCDATTNLYVVDLLPDDPLGFGLDTLIENVDMQGIQPTFGAYADQEYVRKDIVPHYLDAKETGNFSRLRLRSRIQDQIAVYDRLILPIREKKQSREQKQSRWALSITKTRLLLPAEPKLRVLTDRQQDILYLLAQGLSSKEAAQRLAISYRTVEHQIEAIKKKLGARNVTQAVAIAVAQSIID